MQDQANAAEYEANRLPDYPLPGELIRALTHPGDFRVYRSVSTVPTSVQSAFAKAAREEHFRMAEPDGRWEPTDVITDPKLPRRRLKTVAMNANLCLLFYEHGGIGKSDNIAAFRILGDHAEPAWHAYLPRHVEDAFTLAKAVKEKNYREAPFF